MDLAFPAAVYAARLDRARSLAGDAGIDAIIVGPGADLDYLVGVRGHTIERLTALVIPASGAPTVVVPRMELSKVRDTAVGALGLVVADWVDGDDPYASVLAALPGPVRRVAVSDELPALHTLPLADRLGLLPELATPVLREGRMIKDEVEIAELRRAGAAIDAVHRRVPALLRAGRTEREVAADIAAAIVEEGHATVEFVIVGSGPNGADPHHEVSDRVIADGDIVVVDIGGALPSGYNSDSTRTYAVGDADAEAARRIAVLVDAQRAAVAAVRPGVTAAQVDAAARDVLRGAGYGEAFVHRTGHGIGISTHEEPYIAPGQATVLRAGMAFSVEPGIYFPGEWGARIEDIVVVTDDGVDNLNRTPHALTRAGA
ncbi:aminopeptidase P family protein [Microbacterium sp. VKM Ac-2870]|uniref:M24 family metallopeptidase n=1 Tax=Microbacterium sp. VKM Ac-2870 TaxID=2783825 RepID=UPI00188CBF49|nr:Xaa-Pro peptidase family protein [Microbacterium sp. VKM Ac-2870]MBF4563010.1 aminopeptidase P family protein [Microbacterium sp. VKM Ac-2870]